MKPPVILSQYPMQSNRRAVVRLRYEPGAEAFTCVVVEAGVVQRDSEIPLSELEAAEHYDAAYQGGTVYEPFPGLGVSDG